VIARLSLFFLRFTLDIKLFLACTILDVRLTIICCKGKLTDSTLPEVMEVTHQKYPWQSTPHVRES
jgi:hypothetical protein